MNKVFSFSVFIKKISENNLLILLVLINILLIGGFIKLGDQSINFHHILTLPLGISVLISSSLGYISIPLLKKLKIEQVIQEDGIKKHFSKAGTPTMGGIFFIPVAILIALVWSHFSLVSITISLVTLSYMVIGWVDDWCILRKKSNLGLSPRTKLFLQIIVAIIFCVWIKWNRIIVMNEIILPGNIILETEVLFWLLSIFVLVSESNAVNLTDGIDGLAGGTGALTFLGLAIIVATTSSELSIFCASVSGSCLGFILHNNNPAKVFMGDTGSLALGGALAGVGILSGHFWELFILSGIFFIESLSVIAQVTYYKMTKNSEGKGKRFLMMAPLHHHLELVGWSENKIVKISYLINTGLIFLVAILYRYFS
ncbi:MAG: phospho-N-acetylmuramoyl-pentapeptide-transferase [Candidatus Atelocyanobacterium thalassa]|uniref:Phospho-N-acetylmuramoyl-pentapeptide-transferase n=1 Tax=Candidatus Atelocyanobacterium thalassa isolate SIO64986 TaxID=1527444 RepID=A0A086CH88_9CHRO|nr:MAG: Phospho-N-acetylmuramoyl-pentapeptide- transferase [Candidatus Atelocyanobacterium thalassa isolate SIO64986]